MGSGASAAGVGAAISALSAQDLQAILADLPGAERARLVSALHGAQPRRRALPATLAAVDADFVAFALRRGGYIPEATRIASMEKTVFGREKGYMGDKCLLKDIGYDPPAPGAPGSVFVKLFPADLVVSAAGVAGMWRTEIDFITRMLGDLPGPSGFRAPSFYFAEFDAEGGQGDEPPRSAILMEPINAKPCNIITSMPVSHAVRAARDLAALHALYWGWSHARYRAEHDARGQKKFERYGHIEDEGRKRNFQNVFNMGSKLGLEIFGVGGPLSEAQLEDFSGYVEFWRFWEAEVWPRLRTRWAAVFARWASIPAALIHGDLHVENMFCLEDGTNVYIDFQAVNLGPGVRDLAWLLASSLKAEERREHERAVVGAYHEALAAHGVEYEWGRCWEDFVFMKIHGLFAGALGAGIFAGKCLKEKTGIFAPELADDAALERARNNVLFARVVDDLRHSDWPGMLQGLPEDPEAPGAPA